MEFSLFDSIVRNIYNQQTTCCKASIYSVCEVREARNLMTKLHKAYKQFNNLLQLTKINTFDQELKQPLLRYATFSAFLHSLVAKVLVLDQSASIDCLGSASPPYVPTVPTTLV